jgi:hypothetical protein
LAKLAVAKCQKLNWQGACDKISHRHLFVISLITGVYEIFIFWVQTGIGIAISKLCITKS